MYFNNGSGDCGDEKEYRSTTIYFLCGVHQTISCKLKSSRNASIKSDFLWNAFRSTKLINVYYSVFFLIIEQFVYGP